MRLAWLVLLSAALSTCGVVTEQSIYEGIRTNERAKSAGSGAASDKAPPDYDQYRKERDGLKR